MGRYTIPPDWPLAESSERCHAGGVEWHFQRIGSGPPLLLLHGTGASAHSWAPVAQRLMADFECLIPDLPGHGFSSPLAQSTVSLPAVGGALQALLDALDYQPALIAGHSAGSAIAVQMALNAPSPPAHLLSVNGAFLPFGSLAAPWFSKAAGWLARAHFLQLTTALHGYFRRPVRKLLEETGSLPNDAMISTYQVLLRRPEHIRGTLHMMAGWDLEPLTSQLVNLHTPIDLVVCLNDKTVAPRQSVHLAERVSTSQIIEIPKLGHFGHEEDPETFAALIRDGLHRGE